jgi:O-antigen/teichoic acid export membrane protein
VITNICAFLWTILIARYLGVSDYGTLSFVISFTVLIGMCTDIGITTFTTRELSQNRSKTKKYIDNLILYKILLSVVLCIFTVLIVYLLGYSNLVVELTLIMFIEASFVTMFNFVNGVFQAHESLKIPSLGIIIYSLSLLLLIFIITILDLGIIAVAIAYALGYLFGLLYVSIKLIKEFGLPKFEIDLPFWKEVSVKSLPFGLTIFFYTIYFSIDVVMISWLAGDYATGLYNSAYKVISVFTAFYVIYQYVIFPLMSKLYTKDTNMLKISFEQSFKYSLLILLPIIVGVYFYSPYIITLIYSSEFALASVPMQILIWTVVFLFINGVATSLLNSIGKEYDVTRIYVIAAIFNVALNYFLIPKYTYIGASVATVLSEILILGLMMYSISKTEYKPDISLLKTVIKLVFCGIILAIVLYLINVSLWLAIPIGLIVYIISLILTKSIDDTDKYIVRELLGK